MKVAKGVMEGVAEGRKASRMDWEIKVGGFL